MNVFKNTLSALLSTEDPPTNYGLTVDDIQSISGCYDWENVVNESNWSRNTNYDTVADMIKKEPDRFLADISSYYGDDYYSYDDYYS